MSWRSHGSPSSTVGALILLVGQIIFVWNFVQSWLEGPTVDDGDPWDLQDTDLYTAEWDWYDSKLQTAIADGGEEETPVPDGGQETADDEDDETAVADGGRAADAAE